MDIRRYAPLRAAGASWKDIAAQAGCDWRTAKKYLSPGAPTAPPRASSRAGTAPRLVDPFTDVIDAWLADDPRLRATVIHERLVADYGFTGQITAWAQLLVFTEHPAPMSWRALGPLGAGLTVAAAVGAVLVWWRVHPATFDRFAAPRLRSTWRRWTVYRGRRWAQLMSDTGLTREHRHTGDQLVPRVLRVR
ncbi:hypothetical protein [Pseudonocardia sp. NPDC046786]|uniref:hypothetical protein n=1 Tax=Pseudonocardia sp. NPDC046786 TaxID=3155471 RepID=UPI0033C1FDA3